MKHKAISAGVLALGLVMLGGLPAQAHTGDLNATATCETDGTYTITYTLTTSNTSLAGTTYWRVGDTTFDGIPTSNAGLDRGPVASTGAGTYTLGSVSVAGTSTKAPWAYAFTTWTDDFKKGSDGGDIALAGTCNPPVDVCPNLEGNQTTVPDGYTLVDGSCELIPETVIPETPTFHDECGIANDTVTVPEDSDAVTYTTDDQRVDGVGTVTITATANDGFTFKDGTTTIWTFTFTNESCPTPTPTPSTPEPTPTPSTPELPYTGVSDFWPLLAIGGGLLLFGSTLALVEHSQRRRS